MKNLNRIIVLNLLLAYGVLIFTPFSISGKLKEITLSELLTGIWVLFTIFSSLYLWAYSFYHWKKQDFKDKLMKAIWFLVILIGGFGQAIGPVLYHILVVEFKLTLLKKT